MNYIIHTPSAVRLKKEIFDYLSRRTEENIVNWQSTETEANEKVLVHTSDQWETKGFIALRHNASHNSIHVRFHYWDSCTDRTADDEKILFGRFTEFVLVHFSYYIDKIVIE